MAKIVIDAGHGRNTAGKRCPKSLDPNETREWVLNARVAEAVADLKLRAGANTGYGVLASVPKGGKVRCYGYYTRETDGTIWLYVIYNGQVGFISKNYLT